MALGGVALARDIGRKLRLTAALLGSGTRKELASAFHKANPATAFDVVRADKWLQGRANPRGMEIYDDWAKVLGIDRPGRWIADCAVDAFLEEIAARHGRDREELRRRADEAEGLTRQNTPGSHIVGTYVCYSHSWSPYFRGRLIRGELSVSSNAATHRLKASYSEVLPTGTMTLDGTGALNPNDLRFELQDRTGGPQIVTLCLFPPKPPASVLCGLMLGTALIGPEPQPSVTPIVMVRAKGTPERLRTAEAYLAAEASISDDLADVGVTVLDRSAVDRQVKEFLGSSTYGVDHVPLTAHRALVDLFDRSWLSASEGKVRSAKT